MSLSANPTFQDGEHTLTIDDLHRSSFWKILGEETSQDIVPKELESEKLREISLIHSETQVWLQHLRELVSAELREHQSSSWGTSLESSYRDAELDEDIRAIELLQDYADYPWYDAALRLLASSEVSDAQREALYDILANNGSIFQKLIDKKFWGEMFHNKDQLNQLLTQFLRHTHRDEIEAVFAYNPEEMTLSELEFAQWRVKALLSDAHISPRYREQLEEKYRLIQEIISSIQRTSTDNKNKQIHMEISTTIWENWVISEQRDWEKLWVQESKKEVEQQIWELQAFSEFLTFHNFPISPVLQNSFASMSVDMALEDIRELRDTIISELRANNGAILRDILLHAQSLWKTVLDQTREFLRWFAQYDSELWDMIDDIEAQLTLLENSSAQIQDLQIIRFFGDNSDASEIIHNGDILILDDMQVDTSGTSAQAYIVWQDGLRLPIELPEFPNKQEIQDTQRTYSTQQRELQQTFQQLTRDYQNIIDVENRLIALESLSERSPEEQEELDELRHQETQREILKTTLESSIADIESEALRITREFEWFLRNINFDQVELEQRKQRVRSSLSFIEDLGVSSMVARFMNLNVFSTLSGNNSIRLPSGDIVSGFDPATMTFEWTFSPAIWEWWANDPRTRKVFIDMINMALWEQSAYKVDVWIGGEILFYHQWERIDKTIFMSHIQRISGRPELFIQARGRLFDGYDE